MLAWIKTFTDANPNIKIKAEILPWANYWSKLQTTVAGGNAYDIIGMAGGNAAPYFDQGALMDLSTLSDYQTASQNLAATMLQQCNWKGKQYALPVGIYVPVLGYNKQVLSKAGVANPDPVTPMELSDFMAMVPKLSLKSGSQYTQYAININDLDPLWTAFVMDRGGQVYDNPINPTKILINTPEGIQGLADWQNLYTSNAQVPFAQQASGPWGTGDIDSLLTGKVAFARLGAFDFAQVNQQNLLDQIGIAPIFAINGKQTTMGNVNSFAIFANSKHPNEAWQFLKYATGQAGNKVYGQLSDLPSNQTDFNSMSSFITPASYVPTLTSAAKGFAPIVMTPHLQYATDLGNIMTDLANSKITPAQAAAQIEQKGNADLAAAS